MQQDVSHPAELCAAHHAGMIHCAAANRFTFGPTVTNQLDLHVQLPVGGDLGQQFSSQFQRLKQDCVSLSQLCQKPPKTLLRLSSTQEPLVYTTCWLALLQQTTKHLHTGQLA
jgi:hypothetical protein